MATIYLFIFYRSRLGLRRAVETPDTQDVVHENTELLDQLTQTNENICPVVHIFKGKKVKSIAQI